MGHYVWFQLVDDQGRNMAKVSVANVVHKPIVAFLRIAVVEEYKRTCLREVAASILLVFANRAAFDEKREMEVDDSISLRGESREDPVIVQVPVLPPTMVVTTTPPPPQPPQAPRLRWKPEPDLSSSLQRQALHFVNRDHAVEQLCKVHQNVFIGANFGRRKYAWQIALADNELGLGKTEFGLHYIQRCRDTWPNGCSMEGFRDSLIKCRTLRIVVDPHEFADAVSSQLQPSPLAWTITKYLVSAVKEELDLSDGATLPEWLASPPASHREFLEKLIEALGPVFIVLDEIGQGFTRRQSASSSEEESRELFLEFCRDVLSMWMTTKGLYFVLLGYAPYLRNVGERKDHRHHASSPFTIIRLNLHLIRPEKIEEIIVKTRLNPSTTETLATRWKLKTDKAIADAARLMFEKTCGHPRTMVAMFLDNETYEDFVNADVDDFDPRMGKTEWERVRRELRTWQPLLKKDFVRAILGDESINLNEVWNRQEAGLQPGHERSVSYLTIAERCHLGWEGTVTEAKLYALPRVLNAIVSMVQPGRLYFRALDINIRDVTVAHATVFEWACLKRFQELFHEPCSPRMVSPDFFGEDTVFGQLDGVQFPDTMTCFPKITKRAGSVSETFITAETAHPDQWPQVMGKIVAELEGPTNSLFLKPLPQSSSSDVIFMHRNTRTTPGKKRTRDDDVISTRTVTVGIAVKNYSKTEFGPTALRDECKKFAVMFSGLDETTKKKYGTMTNVLIVCATGYSRGYTRSFESQRYSKPGPWPNVDEVLLLDLTTREARTEFFGLIDDPELVGVVDQMIEKTERER